MNENTRNELLRLWRERPEFKPPIPSVFKTWDSTGIKQGYWEYMELLAIGQIVMVLAGSIDDHDADFRIGREGGDWQVDAGDGNWYDESTLLDALIAAAFTSPTQSAGEDK